MFNTRLNSTSLHPNVKKVYIVSCKLVKWIGDLDWVEVQLDWVWVKNDSY